MSDFRTGVNGQVVIDPNEILGIEQDTDPTEDGVSVLLWPGRWRIRARSLAGTGSGAADVSWGAITGKPATFPPDTEATQDVVGSMIVGAGGTYDDTAGTITLPAGGGGAVSSVAGRTGNVVLSSADLTDAASLATDAELSSGLATKANTSHTHTSANITDWAEAVQDTVAAMLVSGANVALTYDDAAGKVTVTAAGGDAEAMRDTIGAALVGVGGVSIAINDAADTITLSISGVTSTQISDSTATGRSVLTAADAAAARTAIGAGTSSLAIGTTGTTAAAGNRQATETAIGMVELATTAEATTGTDTSRAVTPAGLKAAVDSIPAGGTDTEAVQDIVGAMVTGAGGTYDDAAGTITLPSGGGGSSAPMQGGPISGRWLIPAGSYTGNSPTELNGHTCVTPYPVERAVTISKLATRTSAAAGATAVLALYNSTAAGLPGTRIAMTGTLDASAAASITGDITPVTLTPGLYWIAVYGTSGATFVGENFQAGSFRVSTGFYLGAEDPWQYNQLQLGYSVSGAPPAAWPTTPGKSTRGTAYAFVVAQ